MSGSFPYTEVATKIAVALGVGLLVGLEREWAHKEVGARTFAITALLGTLAALLGAALVPVALGGMFLLVGLLNARSLMRDGSLEMTTSAALLATLLIGVLVGWGHYFTAVMAAILVAMLLAWKAELSRFASVLLPEEIRSALLLGLLAFVIYPLLPDRFVDPWGLVNLHRAWMVVVAIAGLGFFNYVMFRLYGPSGAYYAAFLGGLVNSTAAAAELSGSVGGARRWRSPALSVLVLTREAMLVRNLVVLAIFAPGAALLALAPLGAMALAAGAFVWLGWDRSEAVRREIQLASPLSLVRVAKFALLFVGLSAAGTLAKRYLSELGFLGVSLLGGLVSSASSTATAAELCAVGRISQKSAATAAVLASIGSVLMNLPLVYQQTGRAVLIRTLALVSALIIALGLVVLAVSVRLA